MESVEIENNKVYLYKSGCCAAPITDIDKYFTLKIKQVLKNGNGSKNETFYEHCLKYLSKDDTNSLMYIFGFTSEFIEMNAYDSIKLFKKKTGKYFIIKEGFSELVRRMSLHIKYKLNHKVTHIVKINDGYNVDGYNCKKIIFAIPPDNLKHIKMLEPIYPLLESVHVNCLLRIYAIYPNKWFKDVPALTTNSFIRHIIPINSKIGLIMISYVEGVDAEPYLTQSGNLKSSSTILSKIQKELKVLFPNKDISEPTYFQPHLWKIGDHAWKPKYNSDTISKKILNPLPNIYICGEAFSHTQSWIEGALETSSQVIDMID